jgi:hypothetical protein
MHFLVRGQGLIPHHSHSETPPVCTVLPHPILTATWSASCVLIAQSGPLEGRATRVIIPDLSNNLYLARVTGLLIEGQT